VKKDTLHGVVCHKKNREFGPTWQNGLRPAWPRVLTPSPTKVSGRRRSASSATSCPDTQSVGAHDLPRQQCRGFSFVASGLLIRWPDVVSGYAGLCAAGLPLLHPELVHRPKSVRTFLLEPVPTIEVGHRPVDWKALGIFGAHRAVEADESKRWVGCRAQVRRIEWRRKSVCAVCFQSTAL
jgi:hypothetical protein